MHTNCAKCNGFLIEEVGFDFVDAEPVIWSRCLNCGRRDYQPCCSDTTHELQSAVKR